MRDRELASAPAFSIAPTGADMRDRELASAAISTAVRVPGSSRRNGFSKASPSCCLAMTSKNSLQSKDVTGSTLPSEKAINGCLLEQWPGGGGGGGGITNDVVPRGGRAARDVAFAFPLPLLPRGIVHDTAQFQTKNSNLSQLRKVFSCSKYQQCGGRGGVRSF